MKNAEQLKELIVEAQELGPQMEQVMQALKPVVDPFVDAVLGPVVRTKKDEQLVSIAVALIQQDRVPAAKIPDVAKDIYQKLVG